MEVERALLDGEQEAEVTQLQSDKEMLEQLNEKIGNMEKNSQRNQTQVNIRKQFNCTAYKDWIE